MVHGAHGTEEGMEPAYEIASDLGGEFLCYMRVVKDCLAVFLESRKGTASSPATVAGA